MAQEISNITAGQIVRLNTVTIYPEDDTTRAERIQREQKEGIFPELEWNIEDMERYDTVYVGTYLWDGELPPAIKAFLSKKELEGKTLIPFGVSGETDAGKAEKMENLVKEMADKSEVRKGFQPGECAGRTRQLYQDAGTWGTCLLAGRCGGGALLP